MHAEALRACKDERIQEIRALENYAEALAAASHAIYKEKIYTLNDYFTVKEWISNESLRLAEELYCEHALELAMELNRRIESSSLSLPYKIPMPLWFLLLSRKLCTDSLTRATLPNVLKTIQSPRIGKMMLSRFARETY